MHTNNDTVLPLAQYDHSGQSMQFQEDSSVDDTNSSPAVIKEPFTEDLYLFLSD